MRADGFITGGKELLTKSIAAHATLSIRRSSFQLEEVSNSLREGCCVGEKSKARCVAKLALS